MHVCNSVRNRCAICRFTFCVYIACDSEKDTVERRIHGKPLLCTLPYLSLRHQTPETDRPIMYVCAFAYSKFQYWSTQWHHNGAACNHIQTGWRGGKEWKEVWVFWWFRQKEKINMLGVRKDRKSQYYQRYRMSRHKLGEVQVRAGGSERCLQYGELYSWMVEKGKWEGEELWRVDVMIS